MALASGAGNNGIEVVFKNCAPFTKCISEINNMQIDNAKYIDLVIPMYNLTFIKVFSLFIKQCYHII